MDIQNNPTHLDRTNLVAEYLLDGNALDTAGSNDGTATNVTYTDAERGYVSEVGVFNGTASIAVPAGLIGGGTNPFTINIVVNVTSNPSSGGLYCFISGGNGSYPNYQIDYGNSGGVYTVRFFCRKTTNTYSIISTTLNISSLGFINLCYTYNGTTTQAYINGNSIGSLSTSALVSDGTAIKIGADFNGNVKTTGQIGLARIFNKALSQQEITAWYQEGLRKLGPTKELPSPHTKVRDGLVGEWTLNGNTLDTSGNGNNLTNTSITYSPVRGGYEGVFNGSTSTGNNYSVTNLRNTDFTYSIRAKTDDYTRAANRLIGYTDASRHYGFEAGIGLITAGKMSFYLINASGGNLGAVSYTMVDNEYHTYTYKVDSTSGIYLYVDNVLEDSIAYVTPLYNSSTSYLAVGFAPGSSTWLWDGNISNIRGWNKALSDFERNQTYLDGLKYIYPQYYSLPNLEDGKVLSITKPQVGGSYIDMTGNGNNGNATNVTDTTLGQHNVMGFSRSGYISIPSITSSGDLTLYCFFNSSYNSIINYDGIFTKRGSSAAIFGVNTVLNGGGTLQFVIRDSNSVTLTHITTNTYTDGKWHFVVMTRSGNNIECYIDLINIYSGTATFTGNFTQTVYIGKNGIQDNSGFLGLVAEATILNKALSEEEIQQIYYSSFIPN